MKRVILFIFLITFLGCKKERKLSKGEIQINNDSINYYLKKSDSVSDINKKKYFLDKAFYLTPQKLETKNERNILANITFEYYKLNDIDKFNKCSKILYEKSLNFNDTINLGKALRCRALYYTFKNFNDSSFYYINKAEKIYSKTRNDYDYALVLFNKGISQYNLGDLLGSELSLNKAYIILKKLNNYEKIYAILNQLGVVSTDLKDFDKAIFYYEQAIEVSKKLNFEKTNTEIENCYNSIGYIYNQKSNYREAIKTFNLALKNNQLKSKNPELYCYLLDNLAFAKLQSGQQSELPDLFFEALNLRIQNNYSDAIVTSYTHLSEYYYINKNYDEAKKYSKIALNKARDSGSMQDLLIALKRASIVDANSSSKHSEEYIKISDSLQVEERKSKDRLARIQLETDEIIQQKDILEDKNRSLLYTFIGVLFLLSLLFVVRAQRARTKELMFKQAQQRANEEIYNLLMAQQDIIDQSREIEKRKIARDLHDGILSRMFGARLNLDSINHLEDSESVKKRLEYLNELKEIEQDIREISHDLSREKQDLINNFVSITTNLFEEQSLTHSAKLTYFMDSSIKWDLVKNNIKINVFRILQESLQNINKYAKANNIHVEFRKENGELYITVTDDGVGFDIAKKSKGIGMQNMISRAIDCNGKLDISSNKENGTKITLTIPLE